MPRPKPYIGVTGFMSQEETDAVLDVVPKKPSHLLMVGVLASAKTLEVPPIPVRRPERYPPRERIQRIFSPDPRALNLVHYATDRRERAGEELHALSGVVGTVGFQANVRWPDITPGLAAACLRKRTVLQIGARAMAALGFRPGVIVGRFEKYAPYFTDVLLDPSGGEGLMLDLDRASTFVEEFATQYPTLGIGVAGGLCKETLPSVQGLLRRYPFLSIDAEGRLRDVDDHLDLEAAKAYVRCAYEIFS